MDRVLGEGSGEAVDPESTDDEPTAP
jgi:hypothetical protein